MTAGIMIAGLSWEIPTKLVILLGDYFGMPAENVRHHCQTESTNHLRLKPSCGTRWQRPRERRTY